MTVIIIHILAFLNFCQNFIRNLDNNDINEHKVCRVDISQDQLICSLMDDVLEEDSINGLKDKTYYDMNIIDYKSGTMVSVNSLTKDHMLEKDDFVGMACYRDRPIMISGYGEYVRKLKIIPDSITIRFSNRGPAPDGYKNRIYQIKDSLCTRFFMGVGLILLPDSKYREQADRKRSIVTLPARKTKTKSHVEMHN